MISSAYATAQYLSRSGFDKKAYVIGPKSLGEELDAVGIAHIGVGPDICGDSLSAQVLQDVKELDKEVGAVIVSFDQHLSFPKIFKAINYLRNPSAKLIATNTDNKVEFPKFSFPDAGPTVKAIEFATKREAVVLGKPSTLLRENSLPQEAHRDSNRFLMIGDRLNTDVIFGKKNNFKTLLVTETGEHRLSDVQDVLDRMEKGEGDNDSEYEIPDFYVTSMKNVFSRSQPNL